MNLHFQVKHKINSTQIRGLFWYVCILRLDISTHVYFVQNVAYFPFNSWLSFQRLCRLLCGYYWAAKEAGRRCMLRATAIIAILDTPSCSISFNSRLRVRLASLSHWASIFIERSRQHVATIDMPGRSLPSPEFGTQFQMAVPIFLEINRISLY